MNIMRITITMMMLFSAASLVPAQQFTSTFDISAKETRTLMGKDTNVVVLDVRSPREYVGERIADTPLMPLQYLERKIRDLEKYKSKTIIVYCYSGNRSELAVEILREYGFKALNMRGGILRWKAEQYPVISGPVQ